MFTEHVQACSPPSSPHLMTKTSRPRLARPAVRESEKRRLSISLPRLARPSPAHPPKQAVSPKEKGPYCLLMGSIGFICLFTAVCHTSRSSQLTPLTSEQLIHFLALPLISSSLSDSMAEETTENGGEESIFGMPVEFRPVPSACLRYRVLQDSPRPHHQYRPSRLLWMICVSEGGGVADGCLRRAIYGRYLVQWSGSA